MAISDETKLRKLKVKQLFELNQCLKLIYKQWIILESGCIIGIPVSDADKNVKVKYLHGYYRTGFLKTYPEFSNMIIYSHPTYEAKRDMKHFYDIIVEDSKLKVISIDEDPVIIGKPASETEISAAENTMRNVSNELIPIFGDKEYERYDFSFHQIEQLIDYRLIKPCFFDDESYQMYLTISEFPLLRKFKNLRAYTNRYSANELWFDVIFETYLGTESHFMKRRFLRL